jgi:xanthine/uracil permease
VPPIIIGSILIYILSSQISAGLLVIAESEGFSFTTGLIIGPPLLLGTTIAFLPAAIVQGFPALLRPLLGNGFVVGMTAALILEHLVFRNQKP